MRKNFEGYTGGIAEDEVLGKASPEQHEAESEFHGDYITFRQAVDLVKEGACQPFEDPTNPHEKPFPHDVHATLAELLSLENYEQLRYYTAVGSYLDKKHGVDAFFELILGNGKSVLATMDITQNPNKQDYKADVVFQWPREGLDRKDPSDRVVWKDKVNEVAKELAQALQTEARVEKIPIKSLNEQEIKESFDKQEQKRQKRLCRFATVR